ncbi:MAG: hypothetical protein ACOX3V_04455 [Bacillota bacterium]
MSKTVLGVFDDTNQAERAADELQRRGIDRNELSVIAKEDRGGDRRNRDDQGQGMTGSRISDGVATGGAIGGAAGILAGVGALAIPGIGPIVAAGPIAAALTGAAMGGIAGGLVDWGIPEEAGQRYEEHVRTGKVVTLVKTDDDKVREVSDILRRNGAYDVESH